MKVSVVKNVRIWALAALLVFSCFALLACQSDESAIRANLEAELSEAKNLDDDAIARFTEDSSIDDSLAMFEIETNEFVKACFTDFDYTIDEITIDGDTANAKITMTHKDFEAAIDSWQTDLTNLMVEGSGADMNQSELYSTAGTMLIDAIKASDPVTSDAEIPYVKTDGKWELAPEAQSIFNEVFAGSLL